MKKKKKKIESATKDKFLDESGALEALEQFRLSSKKIAADLDIVTEMLSNLNVDAFEEHINIASEKRKFECPWQKLDRPRAYEWMGTAYRAVDALAFYAHQLTSISVRLCEAHAHAQNTVELTEKAFASAQVTTGEDLI